MAKLSLTLFGGFQARLEGGPALALPTRKAQAMLAYLALPPGRAHPRDALAALLWGGIREDSARASLRQALFSIRKALGDVERDVLRQEADTLALAPAAVAVDTAMFEQAVSEGTLQALERAVTLYRGDLLSGFALDEAPLEEWLLGERERLRELVLETLAKLLAHHRRTGATEAAVRSAVRLLTLDPLQEAVHRTLMRCYADLGRRPAALRQYQHCVTALGRELGVEPEAETKTLYRQILRERPQRSTALRPGLARSAEQLASAAGGETAFVGRAAELDVLRAAIGEAGADRGRVVAVLGEAGIGKSRIVAELAREASGRGLAVLLGRAYESEQILPFGPWVDALRTGRIEDGEVLGALAPPLRAELARLLPELGDGGAVSRSAGTDVRSLFESVTRLIGHLARQHPLLVILEDLHWADEMTARLLAFAGRRLLDRAAVVVLTAREDELADALVLRQALDDLQRAGRLTTLSLPALSRADTLALVRGLARGGDEAAIERLGEQAWIVSEGNPFVAVETVRAHTEGASIVHGPGVGLPERVREIVGRRLERLSARGQALAAVAAVVGREFEFALLQRAADLDEDDAASGVEELVRRGVLHGLDERFDFTHDRIRQVAYGRILAPRRKLLHRKVAEAIEALHADHLDGDHLALGLHYREAEGWDRAAQHLGAAAAAARERAANRESAACFDTALGCLRRLPRGRPRSEGIIDAILQQETALMGLGEFQRSLAGLREAEVLARELDDRLRLGRIFGRFAYNLGSIGDLGGALQHATQARAIAVESGDLRSRVSSNVVLARALYARGEYREALAAVRDNDAIAGSAVRASRANVSFSRVWGVLTLAELGQFAEALARADEALRLSAVEFGRHGEVWAHLGVGRLHLVKGDPARAIEVLERGLPLCESGGDLAVYFSRTAASLGGAYALAGRLPEAVSLLERADFHAETIAFAYGHALVIATLAEARRLAGDVGRASADAARALALSRQHGQRGSEAWALRAQGEISLCAQPPDVGGAERSFRAAMALAGERGMRPLLAHCHLGLGEVARLAGDVGRACMPLGVALAEYRAMEMPYWVTRAEALSTPDIGYTGASRP
jgi:DNA-binding SARP family transcriptional activator